MVYDLGFRFQGSGFRVQGLGFRDLNVKFWNEELGFSFGV